MSTMNVGIKRRWWAAPLGMGVAACAVCCAAPLLGALGLGAAGVAAVGAFTEKMAVLLLGAAGVAGVVGAVVWRRRRAAAASVGGASSCAIDGSCGCAVARRAPESPNGPQVSCTLEADQMPKRLDDFRSLLSRALLAREYEPGRFVWILRADPAIEAEARQLAEAESRCCSFFRFDLTREERGLRWVTTAPPEGWPMLEVLYHAFDGPIGPALTAPQLQTT